MSSIRRPCAFPLAASVLTASGCRTREEAHRRGLCGRLYKAQQTRTAEPTPRQEGTTP